VWINSLIFYVEHFKSVCPASTCYFFNRIEAGGARFVSYHFTDQPELKGAFKEATEAINFLAQQ
jgi:hypothetical protein